MVGSAFETGKMQDVIAHMEDVSLAEIARAEAYYFSAQAGECVSIAMLACRDWTNQEIATHLGLSLNTVKHYVSVILEKLQIDKREKIKDFVNQ